MKKADPHARPPDDKSARGYLATQPPVFFRVLKEFERPAGHTQQNYPDWYPWVGDVLFDQGMGSARPRFIRLATPSLSTRYQLAITGKMRDYWGQGLVRPINFQELLSLIPHMSNAIWCTKGQYQLQSFLCAISLFGNYDLTPYITRYY